MVSELMLALEAGKDLMEKLREGQVHLPWPSSLFVKLRA